MNPKMLVAVLLIVLGVVGLTYGRLSYTTREKVVDVGPIEVTKEDKHSIPLPPILGGIALVAGVGILLTGRKGS